LNSPLFGGFLVIAPTFLDGRKLGLDSTVA
jgi:hypothetical protein